MSRHCDVGIGKWRRSLACCDLTHLAVLVLACTAGKTEGLDCCHGQERLSRDIARAISEALISEIFDDEVGLTWQGREAVVEFPWPTTESEVDDFGLNFEGATVVEFDDAHGRGRDARAVARAMRDGARDEKVESDEDIACESERDIEVSMRSM